ncbi:hypothetical protein LGL55_21890 [Clostridium tagluense]|uniref:hypothetical protein n=1 Tax=Clostridium TaxID=1485 RepID=UPI0013E94EFA|nr:MULTISPECIES: hypothetical protein [Clostridium]MBZ9626253.1 hypothetical protein [Clostridium sp. FP2]MBZ9637572.1 hypothetical protein [Clostridium sp. FP1]MCB2313779.1 hypothetical protein [Clostridium tagluense]MCB2318596.1 hypothetical protein [Clostridium tagluense]MCB2323442.1 hypothetical protein [Clostridium tagluense]
MIKEDEILKEMFKFIDVEIEPPEGTKERIYQKVLYDSNQLGCCYLPCVSLILEKILKFIIQLWLLICIYMTIFTPIIAW